MKTKSFFGPAGLTSTSANHYCNLAKEISRNYTNYLENVRFYTTTIRVIGDSGEDNIHIGMKPSEVKNIPEHIKTLTNLYSLIAFFREAIKERDRLIKEANNYTEQDAHAELDKEYMALMTSKPMKSAYLTAEEVVQSWSIGEQEKYLSLETAAATIGKYIHEDGAISKARRALIDVQNNTAKVNENGRDTIIYKYIPSVEQEDVDNMYFDLQTQQREMQAELNGMKKKIQDTIETNVTQVDEEYRLAKIKWDADMDAWSRKQAMVEQNDTKKRHELMEEVQALKIVVPKRLQAIYEVLQNVKQ